ncbi:unnamed protein product, partial [Ectocarpus fasciculatus]
TERSGGSPGSGSRRVHGAAIQPQQAGGTSAAARGAAGCRFRSFPGPSTATRRRRDDYCGTRGVRNPRACPGALSPRAETCRFGRPPSHETRPPPRA